MTPLKNARPVGVPNLLGDFSPTKRRLGGDNPNKFGTPALLSGDPAHDLTFFNKVFDTALSLAFQALLNRRFRPNRLAGLYPKNLWNRPLVGVRAPVDPRLAL
jgi:hypothetical protein